MKKSLRMRITTVRQQTVRKPVVVVRAHCLRCQREVETVTNFQAGEILEIDGQVLDCLVANGRVHAIQTGSGSVRVCKDSLFFTAGGELR